MTIAPVIRALEPMDARAYRAFRLLALREHPEAFTSSEEEEATRPLDWHAQRLSVESARPHDFFLGAFLDHQLLAIVGLEGRYRPKERHNATVIGMYVAAQLARQGVGRALMRELIRRATAFEGLQQLELTVTAGNDRAQAIYAHCGFTVFGVLQRAIKVQGQYYAKVHMVLTLRSP